MSKNEAVTPSGIPVFTGNLALLDTTVTTLTKSGASTATAAGDVHSSFGGLQAFYKAPEADQLFATTKPVADRGTSLKSELETITAALSTYASDAAPLVEKLEELKREAESFVVRIKDDDKWREDGDLVEENNRRHDEIAETWAAFQAVERACHDKIVALVGGPALKTDDGSGKKGTYGYDADTLKHAEGLPWGDPVEESKPWWQLHEHAWDFVKGFFVDGVWGTIKGLGTLVGTDGWDSAKQAWSGLGKLATGLAISGTPLTAGLYWGLPDDKLPSYLRESRTAMKETGKALLAWDQWSENPSRALGAVAFNVVTTVFTGGTGGAASGAGKAAVAAKALSTVGKVGRVVDPMTYVFKGAGLGLTKIGDGLAALKGLGQFEIPALPEGAITLPEGAFKLQDGTLHLPEGAAVPESAFEVPANSFKLPEGAEIPPGAVDLGDGVVRLPEGVHPPEGALRIPEGTLKLPDGTTALPENVLKGVDEHGNTVYLDRPGNVLAEDGTLLQHNSAARQEGAGVRASASPDEALVGANGSAGRVRSTGAGGHSAPVGSGGGHEPPSFMHQGADPYGPRHSLTGEQVKEIQVYRANHEEGYFQRYYSIDGRRIRVKVADESGYAPPHLIKKDGEWIAASDAPPPIPERYFDGEGVSRVRGDASDQNTLRILDEAAAHRRSSIDYAQAAERHRGMHSGLPDGTPERIDTANEYSSALGTQTKAAETYGELVAEHQAIPELYDDVIKKEKLYGPANGNDQFDQIYRRKDGKFVVVEAKSNVKTPHNSRQLPEGGSAMQGSREYFFDILRKMEERGRAHPSELSLAEELEFALDHGKLDYILVKGKADGGLYGGYTMEKFDIRELDNLGNGGTL
ncbi:hypothetical protein ACIQZN_06180 [Streptomyces sp. NPDC097595]|uniref:hypothetical protein n=1 Tax=Streptomyces sp. NPDC097595 TaxID=3366090 RepID=UPI0037FB9AF4